MKSNMIKITKTMATKLAKHLLGKVQFVETNYIGYVFNAGQVTIEIHDYTSGYSREFHEYFDNDLETKKPYGLPCYKVYWNYPGMECGHSQAAYYKMNDDYEAILYTYRRDEEE